MIDANMIDLVSAHRIRAVDVVQELPGAEEGDRAGGDEAGDPARGGQDGRRHHLQPQPGRGGTHRRRHQEVHRPFQPGERGSRSNAEFRLS